MPVQWSYYVLLKFQSSIKLEYVDRDQTVVFAKYTR